MSSNKSVSAPKPNVTVISVETKGPRLQKIIGFGGAFTDAAALIVQQTPLLKDLLFAQYYGGDNSEFFCDCFVKTVEILFDTQFNE